MKYTFHVVDVFSSTSFGGNQLAILPDAAGISTEGMQKIAREFNFGDTTFVLPKNDSANACRVRIFSPRTELDFAGHPSVGTGLVRIQLRQTHRNVDSREERLAHLAGLDGEDDGEISRRRVSVGGATAYVASGQIEVPPSALVSELSRAAG